ncbi:MAG: isoamylase early set domain-containing protein [Candidatus Latescibacterota bacterium]|nr:MAG: isoamylase early set domain-containing protein [Candidatus Latescibacterota bacterium]
MSVKSARRTKQRETPGAEANMQNNTVFACDLIPDAKEVYLVGEFNNWDPRADRMVKRKGTFRKTLHLAPGEYQYKFLIDGEWHNDPAAKAQVPNEFGTMNSVVRVREISDR